MSYSKRRGSLRVPLDAVCNEYVAERHLRATLVDASEEGLRVQRPLRSSGTTGRVVQLEFELPGTGELIWAKGEICFDQLWRVSRDHHVEPLRTSGIRVLAAASKHLRLLRDYVIELRRGDFNDAWLLRASAFRSG